MTRPEKQHKHQYEVLAENEGLVPPRYEVVELPDDGDVLGDLLDGGYVQPEDSVTVVEHEVIAAVADVVMYGEAVRDGIKVTATSEGKSWPVPNRGVRGLSAEQVFHDEEYVQQPPPKLPPFRVWANEYLESLGDRKLADLNEIERAVVECISLAHSAGAWREWPGVFVVVADNRGKVNDWARDHNLHPKIVLAVSAEHHLRGRLISPRQKIVHLPGSMSARNLRAIDRMITYLQKSWERQMGDKT